jgi:hypothetical protein
VQEVLVDGGQFVFQLGLQVGNDLCVAFHGFSFDVLKGAIVIGQSAFAQENRYNPIQLD